MPEAAADGAGGPDLSRDDDIIRPTVRPRHRLARLGYQGLYSSYRIGSILLRPRLRGALALVRVGGDILIVRNSYNRWHTLPGGRVDRGETFRAGASRELREETGIILSEAAFTCVHAETHRWQQRTERIEIHATELETRPAVYLDAVEIAAARWTSPSDALKLKLYPPLRHYLETARDDPGM